MGWGFLLIAPAILAFVILNMVLMYRLAGIRPNELERRRLTVVLAGLAVCLVLLAALFALRAPGVQFYWIPAAAAVYLRARQLQKTGHWLVTPTAEELAAAPARRQAIAATLQRPAFWLLLGALVVGFVVITVGAAIIF